MKAQTHLHVLNKIDNKRQIASGSPGLADVARLLTQMSRVNIKGWGCLCTKVRYVSGGAFGGKEGETLEMKKLL